MANIFILGAGFSKAVSDHMPTLWQLSRGVVDPALLPAWRPECDTLRDDVEQLLTFLHQSMPWKRPEEVHEDRATFLRLSRRIGCYIRECEVMGLQEPLPQWCFDFVNFLHSDRSVVATLNYDTVVETLSSTIILGARDAQTLRTIHDGDLYKLPISPLISRQAGLLWGLSPETFRLLKLHGSTNWLCSGDGEAEEDSQVYYEPARRMKPVYSGANRKHSPRQHNTVDAVGNIKTSTVRESWEEPVSFAYDLTPVDHEEDHQTLRMDLSTVIIPPVADKSTFYRSRLVRVLWSEFREAIERADQIFCIGYSLPKTDLTMRLFLRSSVHSGGKRVFVVDCESRTPNRQSLLLNYREVFAGCTVDERYLGFPDCVERMVRDLPTLS